MQYLLYCPSYGDPSLTPPSPAVPSLVGVVVEVNKFLCLLSAQVSLLSLEYGIVKEKYDREYNLTTDDSTIHSLSTLVQVYIPVAGMQVEKVSST